MLYELGYDSLKVKKRHTGLHFSTFLKALQYMHLLLLQNVDVDRDPEEALETVPDHI